MEKVTNFLNAMGNFFKGAADLYHEINVGRASNNKREITYNHSRNRNRKIHR